MDLNPYAAPQAALDEPELDDDLEALRAVALRHRAMVFSFGIGCLAYFVSSLLLLPLWLPKQGPSRAPILFLVLNLCANAWNGYAAWRVAAAMRLPHN